MSNPTTVRVDVRVMCEVDGEYHHLFVAVNGETVARFTDRGFTFSDTEAMADPEIRRVLEVLLRATARGLTSSLEGVHMLRGALRVQRPGEPAARVQVREPLFPQEAAAA